MKLLRTCVLIMISPLALGASVITSGTISIAGAFANGNFDFSGSDFSASGPISFGNWALTGFINMPAGSTAGVNGFQAGNDFGPGAATIGTTDLIVDWGALNSAGSSIFSIIGLPILVDAGPGTYESTFTFTGSLCGTQGGAIPLPCVANLPSLTGSGIVSANFVAIGANLSFSSATYTFTTPEAGAWILMCCGIAGLLALRRFPERRAMR